MLEHKNKGSSTLSKRVHKLISASQRHFVTECFSEPSTYDKAPFVKKYASRSQIGTSQKVVSALFHKKSGSVVLSPKRGTELRPQTCVFAMLCPL